MAVQISGNDITVPRDGSFTRNVTIGGTLTYEDVTNIDSVGLVTARTGIEIGARPGVAASISVDGNMIVSGISTFNDKVLLGTTTPGDSTADDLTIATSGSTGITIRTGTTNQGNIYFADGTAGTSQYAGLISYNHNTNHMFFGTNDGTERLRITSGGDIGIGTDSPAQAVHINRSSGDTYIRTQGGTNQGLLINKTDGTLLGGFVSGGAVGGSANDIAVRTETGNNIVFAHGTTERFRITSGGQLFGSGNTGYNESAALISFATDDAAGANMLSDSSAIYNHSNPAFIHIQNRYNTGDNQESGIILHSKSSQNASWAIYNKRTASYVGDLIFRNRSGQNASGERLRLRGSDGRVLINNDVEFNTDGSGGLFGKMMHNSSYTANSNLDIAITQGNYIFSVRSGGVYHYNAIFVVTYFDSVDKNSSELVHGDYQTTSTHTVVHNGSNNGTFRLTFNRNFDGINIRQLKLS